MILPTLTQLWMLSACCSIHVTCLSSLRCRRRLTPLSSLGKFGGDMLAEFVPRRCRRSNVCVVLVGTRRRLANQDSSCCDRQDHPFEGIRGGCKQRKACSITGCRCEHLYMISQGDFVTSHAEKLSRVQARHSRDSRSPPPSAQGKLAPCP